MAKYKITERKITDYVPDMANANMGSERGLAMLEDSLAQDGVGRSITVDAKDRVNAGSKTQEAAVNVGIEDVIEVATHGDAIIVHKRLDWDLDDPEGSARRYAYRDNRTSEVSLTWNVEQLLADLNAGVDLSAMWREDELAELLAGLVDEPPAVDPGAQVDKAAELQQKWQVVRGDLWRCGKHLLLCGDSTNAEDVARVMAGERADAVVTDPPYGMNLETDTTERTTTTSTLTGRDRSLHSHSKIIGDDNPFNRCSIPIDTPEEFWFGADYYVDTLPNYGKDGSWFVWDKRQEGALDEMRGNAFELCWSKKLHRRELLRITWIGVLGHNKNEDGELKFHPTQKPVKLLRFFIEEFTKAGDVVIDPFVGSGSSLVACQQLGRQGRGIEISENYCAVILERMSGLGLEPERV